MKYLWQIIAAISLGALVTLVTGVLFLGYTPDIHRKTLNLNSVLIKEAKLPYTVRPQQAYFVSRRNRFNGDGVDVVAIGISQSQIDYCKRVFGRMANETVQWQSSSLEDVASLLPRELRPSGTARLLYFRPNEESFETEYLFDANRGVYYYVRNTL